MFWLKVFSMILITTTSKNLMTYLAAFIMQTTMELHLQNFFFHKVYFRCLSYEMAIGIKRAFYPCICQSETLLNATPSKPLLGIWRNFTTMLGFMPSCA